MAEKEKKAEAAPAAEIEEAPKKKKGLIRLIAILILVLAAGGGGAWYFVSHKAPDATRSAGKVESTGEGEESGRPPVFEKLDTFTVNLSGGQDRYLQAEISLKIADAEVGEKIKARMPEVRDRIVRLLSSRTPDALASGEGKEALARDIQQNLNQLLGAKGKTGVESVLFTSFIIQ
jgi:flagellar FliL protein